MQCKYLNQSTQRGLRDNVLDALNVCKPQRKLCAVKICESMCVSDLLNEPEKHLPCTVNLLASNKVRFE